MSNKSLKLRYKGIEELGNNLKSMKTDNNRHATEVRGSNRACESASDSIRRQVVRSSHIFDASLKRIENPER